MAKWFKVLDLKSGGHWLTLSGFVLSTVASSTPHLCCVISLLILVSLAPVGILNSFCSMAIIYFFYLISVLN